MNSLIAANLSHHPGRTAASVVGVAVGFVLVVMTVGLVRGALRERGHEMVGIRLDSGDLAYFSVEARKRLDAAGFPKAIVVASNDLDEHLIASLKEQGGAIDAWGVGTRLVTAHDQPALGGVYKMSAVRRPGAVTGGSSRTVYSRSSRPLGQFASIRKSR